MSEITDKVISLAKSLLGSPYVWGAWGKPCTVANRKMYIKYAPTGSANLIKQRCPVLSGKQSTCTGCKYEGRDIYDCRGFTYCVLRDAGAPISTGGCTTQWNTKKNWLEKGVINDLPDVVCCVFEQSKNGSGMSHTGFHIGGGKVIHCSGEVKWDTVESKHWTHYAIPKGLYKKVDAMTILRKGSTGDEVKSVQAKLKELGFYTSAIDGVYGNGTVAAVKNFQSKNNLEVDGIVGTKTWAALNKVEQEDKDVIEPAADVNTVVAAINIAMTALAQARNAVTNAENQLTEALKLLQKG